MKRYTALAIATLAAVGTVGMTTIGVSARSANADNRGVATGNNHANGSVNGYGYNQSMASRARVLGMTEEQLKVELQTKTMSQIASEKGISEATMRGAMTTEATARWRTNGLSDAEIEKRVAERNTRQTANLNGDGTCDGTGQGNK